MPIDGDTRRKEGELVKYKNYFSGWGKRYFRLERSYLHYFEAKHSHEPISTVTRGEISQVKPSTTCPGRQNVFEIVHKSGVIWYCQAASPEEMVSWIQALSTVPFVLDPGQYPTVPMDEATVVLPHTMNHSPSHRNQASAPPPSYSSPYRHLMDEAHHTAFTNNTPHECQHYSPPPPYAADGNSQQTPFAHVTHHDSCNH